jgi:acyl-CoA synthetase (AMP-forming)/AMP-acid ligase II/phosphosulfolactate synthase (CoM biosynthesis protein A)
MSTTTARPSPPIDNEDERISELLRTRAMGATRPAFLHGSTGAVLRWTDLAVAVSAWEDNSEPLTDHGTRCVGLLIDDPLTTVTCFLGALGAGVGVAPLNPDASPEELAAHCRALGLHAVVTDLADERLARAFLDAGCDLWWGRGPKLDYCFTSKNRPPPQPPGRAAVVLASSGTTGQPKMIPLDEDQLLHAARNIAVHHELSANDRGYCPLPLFHINALVVGILSTVVAGSSLVIDRRFSRRAFWTIVANSDVTWLNLVPAIIGALADDDPPAPWVANRIRFARSASSPLPPATRERFERRFGISVLETYGMTEAASQITANPLADDDRRPGSVGMPVGTEVRVVGPDRLPVPVDVTGDVEISGRSVVTSYWPLAGAPTSTAPPGASKGWLRTGDLGYLDAAGFLYLVGRSDDVINRGGEKVYPREIENVLLADPRLVSAVVVGRPHPTVGEEPVAFVLAKVDPDERVELVTQLNRRCEALTRYKRPAVITVADTLPVGPTGKVRTSALRLLAKGAYDRPALDLDLPERPPKPRKHGLTMVIDNGMPSGLFEDAITSASAYIDMVKFGWGTALVTDDLERKIDFLHANDIRFCFGGTLFEKFVVQDRFDGFLSFCRRYACDFVEVSNGTLPLSNTAKAAYVRRCAQEFTVVSEVGVKDPRRSDALDSRSWIRSITEDVEAGAALVIMEARESGRSGICRGDGELRADLVDDILSSGIEADRLLFEAPTKALQTEFITRVGANVNLGNIAPVDVLAVETLRLGLRSDTFMHFERAALHA